MNYIDLYILLFRIDSKDINTLFELKEVEM